jgi:hypothetical protein
MFATRRTNRKTSSRTPHCSSRAASSMVFSRRPRVRGQDFNHATCVSFYHLAPIEGSVLAAHSIDGVQTHHTPWLPTGWAANRGLKTLVPLRLRISNPAAAGRTFVPGSNPWHRSARLRDAAHGSGGRRTDHVRLSASPVTNASATLRRPMSSASRRPRVCPIRARRTVTGLSAIT